MCDGNIAGQDSFETSYVEDPRNTVFMRRYGKGPAIKKILTTRRFMSSGSFLLELLT
jgi:hypothetical protein